MAYDYQHLKIETFSNINDQPIAPTATKAGNGSHLISQYNNLINEVESSINSLNDDIQDLSDPPRWNFTRGTYNASPGKKLIFLDSVDFPVPTSIDLYLFSNPQIGDWIEIFKNSSMYRIDLYGYLGKFNGQSNYREVYLPTATKDTVTLIYCGANDGGWIPTKQNIFATTTQAS